MQPDGTVLIDTEIDTDGMKPGTKEVEDAVRRMAGEIDDLGKKSEIALQKQVAAFAKSNNAFQAQQKKLDDLKRKIEEYGNTKIPTEEYSALDKELARLGAEYDKIAEKQSRFLETGGKEGSTAYKRMEYDLDSLDKKQDEVIAKMKSMEESGNAFTLGKDTEQYSSMVDNYVAGIQKLMNMNENLGASYSRIKNEFTEYQNRLESLESTEETARESMVGLKDSVIWGLDTVKSGFNSAFKNLPSIIKEGFSKIPEVAGKAFRKLEESGKKAFSAIMKMAGKAVGKMSGFAKSMVKQTGKMAKALLGLKKTAQTTKSAGINLKKLLLYGVGVESLFTLLSRMRGSLKEGMDNLARYSNDTNIALSALMSSMTQLKNSFAAAFSPMIEFASQSLEKFITLLAEAGNRVSELFSALMGKDTFTKAVKVQQDYAESLDKTSDGLNAAAKEAKKALAPFDDLRQIQFSEENQDKKNELQPSDMFQTEEVSNDMKNLADDMKSVFEKMFRPLKEAWSSEGQFVIDSWKYALSEIGKLIKDIGRDFLEVWQQPATTAMQEDILHIIGDIGLAVGNVAAALREAWNYNNTGLHILENIRDIFAVIIHNIREAADYTVEWTKTLDFRPLLTTVENLTGSLIRFADFVSGTLADFYTQFILPLTSWTLSEEGLPRLFNILSSFMNEINWEGLREGFRGLYQALEPYAEEIGRGLLDFIERIKNGGVNFLNELSVSVQKIADSLKNSDVVSAFEEFGNIAGNAATLAFNFIKATLASINWAEIGASIASFLNGIDWESVGTSLFTAITTAINGAINLAFAFIQTLDWKKIGRAIGDSLQTAWESIDWQRAGKIIGDGVRGILDFLLSLVQEMDWNQIGRDIGTLLGEIPWSEIFTKVFDIIWTSVSGLISGLLDTKSGKIFIAISAGIAGILGLFKATDFALTVAQWATGGTNKFTLLLNGAKLLSSGLTTIMGGISALFSPTGLLIAGIAAAVVLIIANWDKIKEGAKRLLDSIRSVMDSIVKTVSSAFKKVADTVKSIKDAITGASNSSYRISGGDSGGGYYSARSATPMAAYAAIPYNPPMLATGTVVPPRAGISYFGIGDNNKEPEVVSPLSTMVEAFKQAMVETGLNGNRPINIEMQVKGQTFARLVYEMNNEERQRVGVRMVTQNG